MRCASVFFAIPFFTLSYSACSADDTPPQDLHPPPAFTGDVTVNGKFRFGSDAETYANGTWINHWVCNMDDEGLVFVWEKARLSRPTGNALPRGCQDDPHPVGKVAEQPDYDAPIRYTQSGRNRSAAIYVPDTTASPTSGGDAQQAQPATDPNVSPGTGTENKGDGAQGKINGNSRFRTIFLNSDNIPTPIDVNLDLSVENDTLNVNLKVEPSYLKVALGSMGWVQSGDFVANVEAIYSAAKEKDLEVLVTEPAKVLGSEDIAWIPNVSKTESLLLLSTGKEVFSSEIGLGLKAGIGATMHLRTATLFILDRDNGLIGTGAYSALTPE